MEDVQVENFIVNNRTAKKKVLLAFFKSQVGREATPLEFNQIKARIPLIRERLNQRKRRRKKALGGRDSSPVPVPDGHDASPVPVPDGHNSSPVPDGHNSSPVPETSISDDTSGSDEFPFLDNPFEISTEDPSHESGDTIVGESDEESGEESDGDEGERLPAEAADEDEKLPEDPELYTEYITKWLEDISGQEVDVCKIFIKI